MKVWKNILLLTALPITTFVVPQVLSSCYNTKNKQSNEKEEKKGYTSFDSKDIKSVTTLDNNMYEVGFAFGKEIVIDSKEEISDVKFIHWDDTPSDLVENWKTREFIIDLTKMRNLENIHANLKDFIIGAYQSYCLNNLYVINKIPKNPWFRIVFPSSLKKFVYLENVDTTWQDKINDLYVNKVLAGFKNVNYQENNYYSNYSSLEENDEYVIENIKYKYDLQLSKNLKSFQTPITINSDSKNGLYGDLVIPKSVEEYIPPMLIDTYDTGHSETKKEFYVQDGIRKSVRRTNEKYNLTFSFTYESVIDNFNKKKNIMNNYLVSNNLVQNEYNFINDISLFPIHEINQYYDTFYINNSFKDLKKLKFLFGGPRKYLSYTYNFSDGTHDKLFEYMINNSEIPKYEAKAKKIIDDITAQIVWIE